METTTMTLRRNLDTCQHICDTLGIPYREVINIKVNSRAKRRFGQCAEIEPNKFEIEISDRLLQKGVSQLTLMNTMLHELLHTCEGCMNHGRKWKAYAARLNAIGYDVKTRATAAEAAEAPLIGNPYKYEVTCDRCGSTWKYMKRGAVVKALQRDPNSCKCGCGSRDFKLIEL